MELFPKELGKKIPRLGEAFEQEDPMVWVKLTCEQVGWTWYIIERDELDTDTIYYVYAVGWDEELTYINRSDLELRSAEWGFPIVRDETFTPCYLSEVQAWERGNRKFPLGRLVATPGALEALEHNNENSVTFVLRHRRGDWGELDAHDVAENEFSLVNGLRLLSAYALKDSTRIWIITEADRSATTILLPEEY
jgi:hypothetical protein